MSAFNGAGTFVISGVGLPYVTGTTISSTVANQLNQDLATGLSTCITKDGQSVPTANIPMGGFKLTGLGVATTLGDALSFGNPATVSVLDVSKDQNAITALTVRNPNAGNAAGAGVFANNGTSAGGFYQYGTGFTASGAAKPNSTRFVAGGAGGMIFECGVAGAGMEWWADFGLRMSMNSGGQVGIGQVPAGGYRLAVNGTSLFNASMDVLGDITFGHGTAQGAGGGYLNTTGFGTQVLHDIGGLSSTNGSGVLIRCVSNGVLLTNGASSWVAASALALKKDIVPVAGGALGLVAALQPKLFHYLTEDSLTAPLHAGFIWEDTVGVWPFATTFTPALVQTNPDTGETRTTDEHKGLSLELMVPLLVKALQEQMAINASLDARLIAGGL